MAFPVNFPTTDFNYTNADVLLAQLQRSVINLTSILDTVLHEKRISDQRQWQSIDDFFLVCMAMIVLLMQCGFAFLEAGSVRSTNTTSILLQNMLDMFACGVSYWLIGYALAYGPDGNFFFGWGYVATGGLPDDQVAKWFFQFVFAATAATIVSGAVAERCKLIAYFIYSTALTAFIYPIASHWAWGGGWLAQHGYQDYAGSGVVHVIGGIASLAGAVILGPRYQRFKRHQSNGRKIIKNKDANYLGHSVPLTALGAFILIFGFLAFNCGSQQSITKPEDGIAVAHSAMNTMISGSFAAFVALLIKRVRKGKTSLLAVINGSLAGMVAVCAGCDIIMPWGAAITGIIAALLYQATHNLMLRAGIDDPLDAVAVHLAGGSWGVLAQPLFKPNGILMTWSGDAFNSLAWNAIGLISLAAWSGVLSACLFVLMRHFNVFRLDHEVEISGLDDVVHGEPAYPMHGNPHLHDIMSTNASMPNMLRFASQITQIAAPTTTLRNRDVLASAAVNNAVESDGGNRFVASNSNFNAAIRNDSNNFYEPASPAKFSPKLQLLLQHSTKRHCINNNDKMLTKVVTVDEGNNVVNCRPAASSFNNSLHSISV